MGGMPEGRRPGPKQPQQQPQHDGSERSDTPLMGSVRPEARGKSSLGGQHGRSLRDSSVRGSDRSTVVGRDDGGGGRGSSSRARDSSSGGGSAVTGGAAGVASLGEWPSQNRGAAAAATPAAVTPAAAMAEGATRTSVASFGYGAGGFVGGGTRGSGAGVVDGGGTPSVSASAFMPTPAAVMMGPGGAGAGAGAGAASGGHAWIGSAGVATEGKGGERHRRPPRSGVSTGRVVCAYW